MSNNSILVFATQHMLTGGIESHLQEFCNNLSKSGVSIDLVIVNSQMSRSSENQFRKVCRNVFLGNIGRKKLRGIWLIKTALQLSFKNYSSLYTNGQGESISLFSKLIFMKNKWIHHHHTSGDMEDQKSWGKNYKDVLVNADIIIACSDRNARDISISLDREINTIPCFSRKIEPKNKRQEGKMRLGYYGRLIPEKGIDLLCKLSQDPDFSDVEFHIWGEGIAYSPDYFSRYINIHHHGSFYGVNELTEVINLLDAFLLLSTHPEGLPICLLELMSAGLPWLATDKGGISDIVSDPYSTRLIKGEITYERAKKEVLSLMADFNSGLMKSDMQIKSYEKKFSSTALIKSWKKILINDI